MFYAQSENKYITEGTPFELGGIQYPQNYLNLSSPEEKAAIGLVEVVATNAPADERFYWVSEQLDGASLTYVNTPKDLAGLKKTSSDQVNATAYSMLLPSDWMVTKQVETGVPMAAEYATFRAAVRTTADGSRNAIEACANVEDLIAAVNAIVWPVDPSQTVQEQAQ